MKFAVTIWNGRVSPLFDTAGHVVVVELAGSHEVSREEHSLPNPFAPFKVRSLRELGVDTIICGAISNPLAEMIDAAGMVLIPWVSGTVDEIIEAFKRGGLSETDFLMPGCHGRGGRFRRGRKGRGGFRHCGRPPRWRNDAGAARFGRAGEGIDDRSGSWNPSPDGCEDDMR